MAVEHVHEDRNTHQRFAADFQFLRRPDKTDMAHNTVCGAKSQVPRATVRNPFGVAEKIANPAGDKEPDPEQRVDEPTDNQRRDERNGYERPTLPMDRDHGFGDGIDNRHQDLPNSG